MFPYIPYFVIYSEIERSNELWWRSKDRFFFIKFSLSLLVCLATYMKTVTIHICNLKVHTESWNLPSNFPDLEKILVKSWECFLKVTREIFFCAGQILFNLICTFVAHHGNAFFFFHFIKVSIYHLFDIDNLEYGKINYCFGKSVEKGLEFWIQKSVRTL